MLLIYLYENSPRCQYVFDLIFKEESGIAFQTTSDIKEFEDYSGQKINYSEARISNCFFIKAAPLLFENDIKKQEIQVAEKKNVKVLFPNEEDDLGFDIFSAVFYLISRYEEYLPFNGDKFWRFKASDSLAFQNDFLQKPMVNIWVEIFKKALKNKFDQLEFKSTAFTSIISYDIDVAYKFKGRSFGRTLGSALKDVIGFSVQNFKERIQTLLQSKKDPWDVYEDLEKTILQNKLSSIFFFLLADKSEHDRNLDYQNPAVKKLVNQVKTFSEIGIHPSFHTSSFPEKILIEKERLEKLLAKKINKSRQHYLKFKLPDTFNALLQSGITEDYSMGFPEVPGFRAGTCKPFYFYDLKNEKASSLKIFPVTCMDATFIYYLEKSPEKSLMEILNLLKEVKKMNGTFIPLFHNDILGENEKWKSVHDKMIQQIKSYLKTV
ncbi:MAG TPA: polysaccharide deacetylase family protein [Hanamia sp.]|nr:polysaccharide deacetylase family protein [Hanamia sp.]